MALDYYTIEEGLDFILSHFEEPIWPRTIFTKTLGKQYTVSAIYSIPHITEYLTVGY
jgi:hypothetical protein